MTWAHTLEMRLNVSDRRRRRDLDPSLERGGRGRNPEIVRSADEPSAGSVHVTLGDDRRRGVRLPLICVVLRPDLDCACQRGARLSRLLKSVRQLVREETPPFRRVERRSMRTHYDLLADGIRRRLNLSSRLRRSRVGVYAHTAEVMAERRLHERLRRRVERLA
jgi:hypothetical protein